MYLCTVEKSRMLYHNNSEKISSSKRTPLFIKTKYLISYIFNWTFPILDFLLSLQSTAGCPVISAFEKKPYQFCKVQPLSR